MSIFETNDILWCSNSCHLNINHRHCRTLYRWSHQNLYKHNVNVFTCQTSLQTFRDMILFRAMLVSYIKALGQSNANVCFRRIGCGGDGHASVNPRGMGTNGRSRYRLRPSTSTERSSCDREVRCTSISETDRVSRCFMCAHVLVHAIANGGCRDTVRQSALKIDSGRKSPCRTGESNLCQPIRRFTNWATSPSRWMWPFVFTSQSRNITPSGKSTHGFVSFLSHFLTRGLNLSEAAVDFLTSQFL